MRVVCCGNCSSVEEHRWLCFSSLKMFKISDYHFNFSKSLLCEEVSCKKSYCYYCASYGTTHNTNQTIRINKGSIIIIL